MHLGPMLFSPSVPKTTWAALPDRSHLMSIHFHSLLFLAGLSPSAVDLGNIYFCPSLK